MDTASLSIRISQDGADSTAQALSRVTKAGGEAEKGFGDLAKEMVGYTTAANLIVEAGRRAIDLFKDQTKEAIVGAASMERYRVTWGVLTGDMSRGADVLEKIKALSIDKALNFEALNQSATTMRNLGIASNDLVPTLSKLSDLAMGDSSKLEGLTMAYTRSMETGSISSRELLTLVRDGIPIYTMLGHAMGVSADQVKKLSNDGKIGFEDLKNAIDKATTAGGQFGGMGDRLAETTMGKWTQATAKWKEQLEDIGKTTLPAINTILDTVNKRLSDASAGSNIQAVLQGKGGDLSKAYTDVRGADKLAFNDRWAMLGPAAAVRGGASHDEIENIDQLMREQMRQRNNGKSSITGNMGDIGESGTDAIKNWYQGMWNPGDGSGDIKGTHNSLPSIGYLAPSSEHMLAPGAYDPPIAQGIAGPSSLTRSQILGGEGDAFSAKTVRSVQDIVDKIIKGQDAAKKFNDQLKLMGTALGEAGKSAYIDSFKALGESLASGANGADSMGKAIENIGVQLLNEMPEMLLSAGLQACIAGNWYLGLALIAASGLVALGAGAADYATSNQSNGISSAADLAALTAYYQSAEAFNQQGAAKAALHGYADGTSFADGAWHPIGERGMELMRVPRGAQIIPHHLIGQGFADGLNVPGGMSVIVNNNATGYAATTKESVDSSGGKVLTVTVEKIIANALYNGHMDSPMKFRYGASYVGKKTT